MVGDVDSHLFVNGGFVCGVGGSECCGDVSQAGYQSSDVVFGESGGLFDAEKRLEAPAFLSGLSDPPSHGCSCFGFVADDAPVAIEFAVKLGDPLPNLLASGFGFGIGLGGFSEDLAGVVEMLGVESSPSRSSSPESNASPSHGR